MNRRLLRTTVAWSALLLWACSPGAAGCGGCAEPIPGGFPADQRQSNAITAKVSANGLRFIEKQVNTLVGAVVSGSTITVPRIAQNVGFGVGDINVLVCDPGRSPCAAGAACDDQNDLNLRQCQAKFSVTNMKMTPTQASPNAPVVVAVDLSLRVNTGVIPLFGELCGGIGPLYGCTDFLCSLEYDSNNNAPVDVPVDVNLELTVNSTYQEVLGFELKNLVVTDLLQTSDLSVSRNNGTLGYLCEAGDFILQIDFVTDAIKNLARSAIDAQVRKALDGFRCRACDAGTNNCPSGSRCSNGVCYAYPAATNSNGSAVCPPALLGLEGRVGVGGFLASFGGPPESLLDLYAVAGGRNPDGTPATKVESGGIVLGIMGGTRSAVRGVDGTVDAPGVAACVPERTFAVRPVSTPIKFDTEAAGTTFADYHMGIALSDNFLDKSMFDAFQSGLLCLNVDAKVTDFLSSALFRTFLPSLGVLTRGQDVPLLVALRPKQAPEVIIGKGTTKVGPNGDIIPDDPLLTVQMKGMAIDFYAFIDERYARLFTLKTDLSLPLSLKFDPATNTVQPVLASLQTALANIDAQNSEMLAENPQIVADLLDAVIGLVQPLLASVLAPIQLPTFSGLKLAIRDARGAVPSTTGPGYQHLALFANLGLPGVPLTMTTDTQLRIVESKVPEAAQLLGPEKARPSLTVEATGLFNGRSGDGYEYAFRVDGGLWSPWGRQRRIDVKSGTLMLQGTHLIEVTSRVIDDGSTEDRTPAKVTFAVDYDAPEVSLVMDPESRKIVTFAKDSVSADSELVYRYRIAGRDWTSFPQAQSLDLSELGEIASLEVEVVDAAGHAGQAHYGVKADDLALQTGSGNAAAAKNALGGCASADLSLLGLAAASLVIARRRRN